MTTHAKMALAAIVACVAMGAFVGLQQREIHGLRLENESLRAVVSVREHQAAPLAVDSAVKRAGSAAPSSAVLAQTDGSRAKELRPRGARHSSARHSLPQEAAGESGESRASDGVRPSFHKSARRQTDDAAPAAISRIASSEDAAQEMPEGFRTAPMAAGKVQWDHAQATGAPDTDSAGDKPTAWAPLKPGSGEQWLQLGYDNAVELSEVNIHETYNPGAISKVAALMPDGSEKVLWQGTAEKAASGEVLETSLPVPRGITASQIKIYVDTNRVNSWPEIDAVELVGTNGSRQWATRSQASSSYSENYTGQPVVSQ